MKYEIKGDSLPVLMMYLDNEETIITEAGAMSWMSPNMQMTTSSGGGLGKMLGRSLSGESLFMNYYTAKGGNGLLACASCFPGSIRAFKIEPGKDMIFQKKAFLAAESSVQLSIHFRKKLGAGFFGGEGFIMERISGDGIAFAEFDGYVVEYDLKPGQQLVLDTGHLAAMTASCSMDIQSVPGLKNKFLGGEGLFNTIVTGPGHVWVQTMPISNVAGAIAPYIATGN